MLTGRRPFQGANPVESGYSILHADPEPLPPDLSLPVARIVQRCLNKEPAQRFQSASDLAFALEGLRNPTGSVTQPLLDPVPRQRRARWIVGVLAVATLAAVGIVLAVRHPEHTSPPAAHLRDADKVTNRWGVVSGARFLADGRVAFSAAFEGTPEEIFVRPPGVARAAGSGVELVDGAGALAAASPHGIPGPELFWEHAHLTPEGNEVLARALFPALVRALSPSLAPKDSALPSHEQLVGRLALTGYDRYLVAKEVLRRLARAPFTGQLDHRLQISQVERVRDEGAREPFEETEARYQQALARDPVDPWLHWNHAILLDNRDVFLARRGEPDQGRAVAEYRRVLELLPQFRDAHVRLAEAYARLGRLEDAEAQCRELLRLRPRDAQARATLAHVAELRRTAPTPSRSRP
jgi:hypothetical protein